MQEKLFLLRKEKKLTQEQIARKIGISKKQYGEKERGETCFTSDEMFEIADIFKLPLGEIFLHRKHQFGVRRAD